MNKRLVFILLLIIMVASPIFLHSQNNTSTNTNQTLFQFSGPVRESEAPSYFGMFIKTIIVLGIFGAGIYYVFKYISKKQGLSFPHLNVTRIITSLPVGANRFIQVLEVGEKYYLIGSTENQINLLTEITDKETIDKIKVMKNKSPQNEAGAGPIHFTQFLNDLLGGITKKFKAKDGGNFLEKQKERLKKLHIKL